MGTSFDPRYGTTPYVTQWNINLQKALPGKVVVDLGYMGNHSVKTLNSDLVRINQTPTSVISRYGSVLNRSITSAADAAALGVPYPYPGFRGTVNSALRQFPQIRANDTWGTAGAPEGFCRYDSMTLIVNRQFTRGLAVYANWVWSKTMCNCGSMLDYYNRRSDQVDRFHRFSAYREGLRAVRAAVWKGKALGRFDAESPECAVRQLGGVLHRHLQQRHSAGIQRRGRDHRLERRHQPASTSLPASS